MSCGVGDGTAFSAVHPDLRCRCNFIHGFEFDLFEFGYTVGYAGTFSFGYMCRDISQIDFEIDLDNRGVDDDLIFTGS